MPELPEMETYKIHLNTHIVGYPITDVVVNREKSINVSVEEFKRNLVNKRIIEVKRRAKYIIFVLDSGKALLLHLMLGGWLFLGNEQDNPDRTKQVILKLGQRKLYFIGLRLGFLHLHTIEELNQELADLGPEPLDSSFSLRVFKELMSTKRGKLKTTLPDQKFIAGIGNCYTDEICFAAQVTPMKQVNEMSEQELIRLYQAIQAVLSKALQFGGYMEHPFMSQDTLTGGFDAKCAVYDRGGETCYRCGTVIVQTEVSSRKTFYCPGCQSD